MRPLILHNVPDDELYTGEDGVQRPYAMIFPEGDRQPSVSRVRRTVAETGSFGKSTRRSRSRTGSAAPKREDATMKHADELFSNFISNAEKNADAPSNRSMGGYGGLAQAQDDSSDPSAAQQAPRFIQAPTEVILRGYQSPEQQYASINHFEQLAGRICEDYPREPPIESRRYKSELRNPAYTRRQPLTAAERSRVSRIAGGEHWVKVTFESADAAEAAIYASPQKILGHLIYAEPFHGLPPKEDAAILEIVGDAAMMDPFTTVNSSFGVDRRKLTQPNRWATPGFSRTQQTEQRTPESQTSTQTIDTGTASSATVTGTSAMQHQFTDGAAKRAGSGEANNAYCRVIPTARRVTLKPAEEALAPQASALERLLAKIPLLGWFSGSIIGSQVPRNDNGDFDMAKASLYWVLMFYLDLWFGLFGRELVSGDKDD
ncbi:Nucleoporin NUP53 [Microdochium nivale]|nr:Nucleoporin NUP53 [Microdochium nivale]